MRNEKEVKIDIDKRTYSFALETVRFIKKLQRNMISLEIGKQLLRSATSIAANVEEAQGAFSKEDFVYKMNTSLKEAKEAHLWLKLIRDSEISNDIKALNTLIDECYQIKNILGKIVKTSKTNNSHF
jgi:four helix bundle protein